MRGAVVEEFGEPLVVQELELAEPKSGEVLVRLVACGVCHTDLYTASGADPSGHAPCVLRHRGRGVRTPAPGARPGGSAPCVLGHEGAGVVERVGDGVTLVAPGDHVITLF